MKLTTKGRFAVAAMIDLALCQNDAPVALAGISKRQKISLSYLEQLFGNLRRHELVASVRGPGGGYLLAKSGSAISVADIVLAVDKPVVTLRAGRSNSHDAKPTPIDRLWAKLTKHMLDYLSCVTLAELVEQQRSKRGGGRSPARVPAARSSRPRARSTRR